MELESSEDERVKARERNRSQTVLGIGESERDTYW